MKNKFAYTGLVFLLLACGGGSDAEEQETSSENDQTEIENIEIDDNGETVTIEDNEGNNVTYGSSNEVPEGFPLDVAPIYEDGKVYTSVNTNMDNESGFVLSYGSNENAATLVDFYKNFYDKSEIISELKMNDSNMINAEKGNYTVSILIATNEEANEYGKTCVSLTVVEEK